MPIWLRKFTYNSIKEYYDQEKKRIEESSKAAKGKKRGVAKPNTKPSYRTKRASK